MKACWKCKAEVDNLAKTCPSCSADLSKYYDPATGARPKKGSFGKTIALVVAGAFALLVIVAVIGEASMTPEQRSKRDAELALKAKTEKAQDAAKEQEDKAAASTAMAQRRQVAKADIQKLWEDVKSTTSRCDRANSNVADSLGWIGRSASIYSAYELADNAHVICRESWSALGELKVPSSIEGDDASALEKTLEDCSGAYLLRQMSLEKMKTVLNGDMRPSAVQEYKSDAQAAQAGVMLCVAGIMTAGSKVGLEAKEFADPK